MIDYDRIGQLRNARTSAWVLALICALVLAAPVIVEDALIIVFCAFFIMRYLEYTTKIRELELYIDELPVRERRSRPTQ